MKHIALLLLPVMTLSACGELPNFSERPWLKRAAPQSPPAVTETLPEVAEVEVMELPEDPADPKPVAAANGFLGTTVASLGDATKPGFWIETPLVTTSGKGKVRYPATGREVKVDLIPITGATSGGSRLSLGAMRLLDAPLTALPEVEVFQM